jgi:CheY-like chemotaxis protein
MTAGHAAPPARLAEILLVDDNPGDVRLMREALREGNFPNRLSVAEDGEAALRFLRHDGAYADAPCPDLILLDLNLPRKNGRQVLDEIKSDRTLRRIPVIVMSTSTAEDDILGSYDGHANCYIKKPVHFDQFIRAVATLAAFWFGVVTLPGRPGGQPIGAAAAEKALPS